VEWKGEVKGTTKRRGLEICDLRFAIRKLRRCIRFGFIRRHGLAHWIVVVVSLVLVTSCVSKSKADARARAAFFAGQQQAAQLARQTQLQGPTVTVLGEVRTPLVRWTLDLTLAKAVIAADYYGRTDPTEIVIQRDGKEIVCDAKSLLNGQDVPLQPSDVIELKH
jgi:hypothetical protein